MRGAWSVGKILENTCAFVIAQGLRLPPLQTGLAVAVAVNTASTCCTSVCYSVLRRTESVLGGTAIRPLCHRDTCFLVVIFRSRQLLGKFFCSVRRNVWRRENRCYNFRDRRCRWGRNNGECSNERRNFIRFPISGRFELVFDIESEASGYEISWTTVTVGMTVNDTTVRFDWVEISIRCWLFSTEEAATRLWSVLRRRFVFQFSSLWNALASEKEEWGKMIVTILRKSNSFVVSRSRFISRVMIV